MNLVERIKTIAHKRSMTIKDLSIKAGIGPKTISNWRDRNPQTETLQKVADVLGVSVDYLLGNTDDMHANKKDESTADLIAAHWGIDLDNLSQEEKAIIMARARDYVKGLVDAFESK
ncbi:helix-turn-helix domain-containing protein [Weissella paramesenteroides]|uniref:helix-turn-helix domain-containing protein n=1 Tax=Weissella paramesenteroides TaxID=1249 RepID=UPI003857C35E